MRRRRAPWDWITPYAENPQGGIQLPIIPPRRAMVPPRWVIPPEIRFIDVLSTEEMKAAEEKARSLLLSHLSPFQRYTFERHRNFFVRGSDGVVYSLLDGAWAAVVNPDLSVYHMRGFHPALPSMMPLYDVLLGQKLLLETDAQGVMDVACWVSISSFGHNGWLDADPGRNGWLDADPRRIFAELRPWQSEQAAEVAKDARRIFSCMATPTPYKGVWA